MHHYTPIFTSLRPQPKTFCLKIAALFQLEPIADIEK